MITGEYAVLEGAEAFAIPSKMGQHLEVKDTMEGNKTIEWRALDVNGELWLRVLFNSEDLAVLESSDEPQALALQKLLQLARTLNPSFLQESSLEVVSRLDFDRSWGLGSSSTLIGNIAKWAEVDAFTLSQHSFGGSGYDVAIAMVGSELIYSLPPAWDSFVWQAPFKSKLFFVHLNKKQNTRESLRSNANRRMSIETVKRITDITRSIAVCNDIEEFQLLITEHEKLIAEYLGVPSIKEELFNDYPFAIKSLGAWGGDFILACGNEETKEYFNKKGYNTVLPYNHILI